MPRNRRVLKYGAKRSFKLREHTDKQLVTYAKERQLKPSTLVRRIIEKSLRRRFSKAYQQKQEAKKQAYEQARMAIEDEEV